MKNKNRMRIFWNFLTYASPLILAVLTFCWQGRELFSKYSDTTFTVNWAIATLAAGLILSNLPQENRWVTQLRALPGVFKRMSVFLMSPTVFGLLHYIVSRLSVNKLPHQEIVVSVLYLSTLYSVLITVAFLIFIITKVSEKL